MLQINAPINKIVKGKINIPASKSISNRALIIQALCKESIVLENLSIADDTKVLQDALLTIKNNKTLNKTLLINVGLAGTAFRFLTAFLSVQKGNFILTGNQRIQERPIKPLVKVLLELGADITYIEKDGFAPLFIKGKELKGKTIEIKANISSQFISALMLIAPSIQNGLNIKLIGEISSLPYIEMTAKTMNYFGVTVALKDKTIAISNQKYKGEKLFIEADWSSSSYFYECMALAKKGNLILENYSKNSIQGDKEIVNIFKQFGVYTKFKNNQIILSKNKAISTVFKYNFIDQPDLAQTVIATCIALNIEGELTGLASLKIKETDRILALQNEIKKVNWNLIASKNDVYLLTKNTKKLIEKKIIIKTYKDHRMAMSFAPLCLKFGKINIKNPEIVSKSNPLFWKQLKEIGFSLDS